MLEVAWLGHTVVVSSIWKCTPNLAVRFADSKELSHVGWPDHKLHVSDVLGLGLYNNPEGTHGTISSFSPLRKRIGTCVIFGRMSSLVQYWWQKRAR